MRGRCSWGLCASLPPRQPSVVRRTVSEGKRQIRADRWLCQAIQGSWKLRVVLGGLRTLLRGSPTELLLLLALFHATSRSSRKVAAASSVSRPEASAERSRKDAVPVTSFARIADRSARLVDAATRARDAAVEDRVSSHLKRRLGTSVRCLRSATWPEPQVGGLFFPSPKPSPRDYNGRQREGTEGGHHHAHVIFAKRFSCPVVPPLGRRETLT